MNNNLIWIMDPLPDKAILRGKDYGGEKAEHNFEKSVGINGKIMVVKIKGRKRVNF